MGWGGPGERRGNDYLKAYRMADDLGDRVGHKCSEAGIDPVTSKIRRHTNGIGVVIEPKADSGLEPDAIGPLVDVVGYELESLFPDRIVVSCFHEVVP